ncbi:hypothetical protein STCU_11992 [Strigomonas culicis]|uniref:Uncharacterized protein n=1 Tax=Strigomonas culicis TaxID=28005 RepID=S9TBU3_9TRYP|nr:hypothetical protein STCU_11992 [Strigomonas culicis]|eukprot:EPY15482.1 hypothetical protein STCU_11992 [Strigomonas culicis]
MYDGVYSAFQIEDYKHFIRFRIDKKTRELHGHVIAEASVPKVWELDPKHVAEYYNGGGELAPHLRCTPSKWRPAESQRSKKEGNRKIHLLETFVVRPHRMPPPDNACQSN